MSALTDTVSEVEQVIRGHMAEGAIHDGQDWRFKFGEVANRHPSHISEAVSIVVQKLRREGLHATKVGLDICVKGGD